MKVTPFNYLCVCPVVAGFDLFKVMLAGKIRKNLTPHNIHTINRISGMILIGFGIALTSGIMLQAADK